MSCVKFTRFTGDARRHEPVEKVKTLHVADFNSLKRLLHTYYEKTEAEFELHLHYENDTRCNGESEISPRLWNALTNIREASPPTSDFPIYYVCFKKHQSESNTNSNNNDKPPFMEPSIKGSPMQDVRGETLPENDCISVQPSPEKCDARPVRDDPTSSSSSREGGGSKKRTWGQGIPERPAKSSRPTPSALPQTLEDKLTGLSGPDDKRCRVVVGVDLDSGCAVWAARNTLGRVYLRRSAFDMQGNLLSDDEGTKAQRVEDTEFSQIRGDSAQSSWDAVKILIESRLDALETVSPRRQLARAQSAVPSTPVRPSQAAVKDGAKTAPARERRRNQTSPSVSPSQRRPQSVHTQRSAGSGADSTSDDDEQSNWEPSEPDEPNVKVQFSFRWEETLIRPSTETVFSIKTSVLEMLKHAREVVKKYSQFSFSKPDIATAFIGETQILLMDKHEPLEKYISGGNEAGEQYMLHVDIEWEEKR